MKYTAINSVTLPAGVLLALTKGQAADRLNQLETVNAKKGLYRTTDLVQFKAGEVLGVEDELPKSLQACLQADEPPLPVPTPTPPPAPTPEPTPAPTTPPAA